jgi:hypothetical protein
MTLADLLIGDDERMTCPQFKFGKSDTTPEAQRVQDDIYRRMSPARKFRLIFHTYEMGRQLAMAGLRMRHPDVTEEEIWHLWARQHLGDKLYEEVYRGRNGFRPSTGGGANVGLA